MPAGLLLGFPGAQDGLSAYEQAVANGFVGTEAQWLASLQGAQGPQGSVGSQGQQGSTGPVGPQGPQGPAAVNPILTVNKLGNTVISTSPYTFPYNGTEKPVSITVLIIVSQAANTGCYYKATWLDGNDVSILDNVIIAGNNISNSPDGGSGMTNAHFVTLPWISRTKKIKFERFGVLNGGTIQFVSMTTST